MLKFVRSQISYCNHCRIAGFPTGIRRGLPWASCYWAPPSMAAPSPWPAATQAQELRAQATAAARASSLRRRASSRTLRYVCWRRKADGLRRKTRTEIPSCSRWDILTTSVSGAHKEILHRQGNQWIGYDTPSSVRRKMKYVKNKKLGGAMIWAIDLDDYLGACGPKWPLLSTMNRELKRELF